MGATLIYFVTRQLPNNFYDLNQNKFVGLEGMGIPPLLVRVIAKLTAFAPEERPQNAIAVKELLQEFKSSLS